ncbi:uncharacterized protein LOC111403481 [Olea europaea var. sylvestris]|uniref:uncharacterized protein LOC111403480 n=1 Tax=Olea europaea var. sylvestris TaxID=158386 RepID=UPI000C1D74B3|nr:uncharacterized protein LOC111403480 [Olea europaea var. sylvestris]XP_022887775.1 uncharacterized protein LOC111403481 [Olea europaea var. sylvestris]
MQDLNNSQSRKPWYQRAMQMAAQWRPFPISAEISTTNGSIWKTTSKTIETSTANSNKQKLRKCKSVRLATSFTRACLCAPISSYQEVSQTDFAPRRSYSYPRSSSNTFPAISQERTPSARMSMEGRRIFRGKSLTDDVLMRRFVIEEEAMMQVRRRNEMEIIRKRSAMRRKKLGPSPLSKMVVLVESEEEEQCQEH